ncbi:MAG TPA: efflux RND transporter periplasmic adaptor subunit [Chryseosolibacter sp.]|nr:efflux RND transporter periplasmic adaptor subunit [Chryseosolibacter sp.]
MKNTAALLLLLSVWFLQACTSSEGKNSRRIVNSEKIPVRIMKLQKTKLINAVNASGQFTTDDETFLSFKTGGIIDKIHVREGDPVRKGQVLATLHLTEINALVSQSKLVFEKAKRDFERVSNLYKDSVATLEQFQNVTTALDVATQQYEAARFNKSYSEIRALSDGYVLRKFANPGQMIESGSPVFQTNGAKDKKWKLRVGVSDRDWSRIEIGDEAVVTTDADREQYKAVVSKKSEGTDINTGTFVIEVSLNDAPSTSIASGMFGKVIITPTATAEGWAIPYDALLDGDLQKGYVFITNDSQKATRAQVTIGAVDKENVIITKGLEGADALIISGSAYLRDESPITILE